MSIVSALRRMIGLTARQGGAAPDDDYQPYDRFLGEPPRAGDGAPLHQASLAVFEDLARIDTRGIQEILRRIDLDVLRTALFGASSATRRALLSRMARRSGRLLWEELESLEPATARDAQEAQDHIMAVATRLIAETRFVNPRAIEGP